MDKITKTVPLASLVQNILFSLYPAVTTVPLIIIFDRFDEAAPVKIRPQHICEIKLRIGQLPEKEIRYPLLTAGTDQKVRIRKLPGITSSVTSAEESFPSSTSFAMAAMARRISSLPP